MKKTILMRVCALALCAVLSSCNQRAAVPVEPVQEHVPSNATLRVVDNPAEVEQLSYVQERPGINTQSALATDLQREADATAGTLLNKLEPVNSAPGEVRSIWISYLDLSSMIYQKSKGEFTKNIGKAFDNVKNIGFNTVMVQVRPFSDALYKSKYFPWSATITGEEGKNPGYDPLAIMVTEAHNRGLFIEAWINPYRIRTEGNPYALSKDNPAKKWLDSANGAVIQYNNIISYNPASKEAQDLIVNGVVEIVKNYDVNGIHIDDYFYPTTDTAFDAASYAAYRKNGGTLSLEDWRRNNVDTLIRNMYAAIKQTNSSVLFGISPQGNFDNNYYGQYLDVRKLVTNPGYCDYICPQVYYGFKNETQPFTTILKMWDDMITVPGLKLYVGLATYKLGAQDPWAGSGKDEWIGTTTQMKDMVEYARTMKHYGGFVLFRYDFVFEPSNQTKAQIATEIENLKSIL